MDHEITQCEIVVTDDDDVFVNQSDLICCLQNDTFDYLDDPNAAAVHKYLIHQLTRWKPRLDQTPDLERAKGEMVINVPDVGKVTADFYFTQDTGFFLSLLAVIDWLTLKKKQLVMRWNESHKDSELASLTTPEDIESAFDVVCHRIRLLVEQAQE